MASEGGNRDSLSSEPPSSPGGIEPHQLFCREDFEYDENDDFLGGGGFAEVFKATNKNTGDQVAAKVLFRNERKRLRGRLHREEISSLRKEAIILLRAQNHPHIIHFVGICEAPNHYTLLLEYVEGVSLDKVIRYDSTSNPDPNVEKWTTRIDLACQVADGMAYLHTQEPPIVHLDLKPQNVLTQKRTDGFVCKITDFGLSKMRGLSQSTSRSSSSGSGHSNPAGTVLYIAPERYDGACTTTTGSSCSDQLIKCDVYSFGVILWEMKERKQPYADESLQCVLHQLVRGGRAVPPSTKPSPLYYDELETECHAFDSHERPPFDEVLDRLREMQSSLEEEGDNSVLWTLSSSFEVEPAFPASAFFLSRDQIVLGNLIGNGKFGCVYRGIAKGLPNGETIVAIKAIKEYDKFRLFQQECSVMASLSHRNVLPLIGICFDKGAAGQGLGPLIVVPFMENGDLQSYLRKLKDKSYQQHDWQDSLIDIDVNLLLEFSIQIISGMVYLKEHQILHRDLAARNCMLDEHLILKVADFGLARQLSDVDYYKVTTETSLPIKWLAPECLSDRKFTYKSDVWSFGVTLWETFSLGMIPYPGMENREVFEFLAQGNRLKKPNLCPAKMYDEIMKICWQWHPSRRLSFTDLLLKVKKIARQNDVECHDTDSDDYQIMFKASPAKEHGKEEIVDDYTPMISGLYNFASIGPIASGLPLAKTEYQRAVVAAQEAASSESDSDDDGDYERVTVRQHKPLVDDFDDYTDGDYTDGDYSLPMPVLFDRMQSQANNILLEESDEDSYASDTSVGGYTRISKRSQLVSFV